MIAAPLSQSEKQRLQDLYSYNILDTEEESDFTHLVELASLICQCKMSVINFIDLTRQWGKAKYGLADTEAPREISMCAHTILQNDVMLVEDTLLDNRFCDNPFTTEGGIRFYAGAPIRSEKGYHLGSICVCDTKPRTLNDEQKEALMRLARQAAILLEVRKKNLELQKSARVERLLKEKAEAARKAQEQFLSTMSHEIRTPLNGIIGLTNILQTENPKPEQQEYLETLQFASKNLLYLVNDILDYNKIAAGKLSTEEVPFNLKKLVEDIRRSHLPKAQEKGISLNLNCGANIPAMVKGDPNRLTQVLNNLIGNAVKFTLQGGVSLNTKMVKQEGDSITVLFDVTDSGIGFEQGRASRLFEPFSQAHKGISRQFGGTGLGLSITKKLLELMGSSIQVKSALGKGSCFSFVLPLKTVQAIQSAKENATNTSTNFSQLKILIAEDNAINIMVTRKILQKVGVEVATAYNGKEAVERIATNQYNLVLMDVQMPVMDGIAAIKKLRGENIYSGPVILLTADALINSSEVLTWGFDDLLLKPFDADELYQKIEKLVKHSSA